MVSIRTERPALQTLVFAGVLGLTLSGCAGLQSADKKAESKTAAPALATLPAPAPTPATAPNKASSTTAKPTAVAAPGPVATTAAGPLPPSPPPPAAPGATPANGNANPAGAAAFPNATGNRPATPPGGPLGGPAPFATLIKDARRIDGPLTLWQKEDKVWIELLPAQMGQPFLLSPKIKSGIGEAWVLGGLMAFPINGAGGPQVVEFQRVYNQVRLVARNTDTSVKAGTPEARAVADAYSNSLLGSVPVVSLPHPERNSILIEANGLFLSDIAGVGMMLARGLRGGYSLDRSNSVITAVRASAAATVIETQNHFFGGASPALPSGLSALAGNAPRYLPDSRSMLVSMHYSLAPMPDPPMPTRRADPRVGLFASTVLDFSDDLPASPRQRFVNRWRLEKKDPAAELSEPVKPIVFVIDRNVPHAYRETVRSAILEWNKAFEKIGFSRAIQVEQQAEDAKTETLDFGGASVRWMMNAEPVFGAIGPSVVDPRSGEILEANIGFEGISTRSMRTLRSQVLPGRSAGAPLSFATPYEWARTEAGAQSADIGTGWREMPMEFARCMHASLAAEQLGYALDVLDARGDIDPDSPIAEQFVLDYLKEAILHEVGHTLGLRHNFRASRAYTEAQLADPEFTRANGTAGSVMEYSAVNLPRPGQTGGAPFQTAIGPYDYWAIEYAYKPMPPGTTPKAEREALLKVAARSNEPELAYGTDEDNFFGIDPETLQMDLGADPVAFASKRLAIARDLFQRQEQRQLTEARDYAVLRRSIGFAINDVTRAVGVLVRQIGGLRTLRDFPGSGRDPLTPVSAKVQREALGLITGSVLSTEGLTLTPALQRRLAPDFLDRGDFMGAATDFVPQQRLLDLQRAVLAYLMSDTIATRVLDGMNKVDRGSEAFPLNELYLRLADAVWSDLQRGGQPGGGAARRDLQRDHVNRLALAVVRPSMSGRADNRGLLRVQTRKLLGQLESAQRQQRGRWDVETVAHIGDCVETLRQALAAPLQRLAL